MRRFGTARLALSALLPLLAASILIPHDSIAQQKPTKTYSGSSVLISSYNEIPEATEECSPEEKQWWTNLRNAGSDLQKKMDRKSQTRFAVLFAEGVTRAYRVPLKDRPPQVLASGRVVFPDLVRARARIRGLKGSIELSIEYRADGSVGDIKIVKSLDKEMDVIAINAARQNIFIPAVKNGAFVTEWGSGVVRYSTAQ